MSTIKSLRSISDDVLYTSMRIPTNFLNVKTMVYHVMDLYTKLCEKAAFDTLFSEMPFESNICIDKIMLDEINCKDQFFTISFRYRFKINESSDKVIKIIRGELGHLLLNGHIYITPIIMTENGNISQKDVIQEGYYIDRFKYDINYNDPHSCDEYDKSKFVIERIKADEGVI